MSAAPSSSPSRLVRLVLHFTAGDRAVALTALALLVYYCATPGIFEGKASGDGVLGFLYLPGLVYHHTFDLGPPVGPFRARAFGTEVTGHVANPCPIGPVLLWFPTYLLGLGLKLLAGLVVRLPVETPPGQARFDYWMAALGSLAAGLSGMATLFRLLRRHLGTAAARFGTIAAVLATPLVWYLTNQPLYQHAAAFWAVTLLVERWDAWRGAMTPGRWAALGALGGLAMLMRLQEAIFLLLPGLDALAGLLGELGGRRRGRALLGWLGGGLLLGATAALVFLPQLLLWRWYFGEIRPPQPPGHMRWDNPGLLATLMSIRGGLIPWSPILYLFLPGLWLGRRRLGGLAGRLGLLFLIEWWVNASAWDHWGSWGFGARRFTDATVVFAAGLGGLWAWLAERQASRAAGAAGSGAGHRGRLGTRLLVGVLVAAVLWNGLLMELVRQRRIKSSGAGAFPASVWVKWAGGPAWLGRIFDRTGFPFIQPVGWIYAWLYDAPVTTFEGVVGNYMLERNWRVHEVVEVSGIAFCDALAYVVEGVAPPPEPAGAWPKDKMVPAQGERLRVLVPLVAREPIGVWLRGAFGGREAALRVRWNGSPITTVQAAGGELRFEVPEALVHTRARLNELVIEGMPPGSQLLRLDFSSRTRWWERRAR